ncbi:MAG: DUF2007 domain-containing protein [Dehalococcoidales bacterium]|nr:DUF2007 domain-containing protein [Dehalococcoidales bacterium]
MSQSKELVAVYIARGETEAQVIKGLLESNGISCLLKPSSSPSVYVFTVDGLGEVKIMVREEDAGEARELIRGEKHV